MRNRMFIYATCRGGDNTECLRLSRAGRNDTGVRGDRRMVLKCAIQ